MVRIGSVVHNAAEVAAAAGFWEKALGYRRREGSDERWALLEAPPGRGPNLALDMNDRTHLDLYVEEHETQAAVVERLVRLGARRVEDWPYPPDADFVVLEDPAGNLFCVVDKG